MNTNHNNEWNQMVDDARALDTTPTTAYLVEICDIPRNGDLTFKVWLRAKSVESAQGIRRACTWVDLAIVEITNDFEYRITR